MVFEKSIRARIEEIKALKIKSNPTIREQCRISRFEYLLHPKVLAKLNIAK